MNTKTYTKKQFLEDVAKEAKALKKHATKEELENLDFDYLDPDDPWRCIYGTATGHCRSDRAVELITKCCTRFFNNAVMEELSNEETTEEMAVAAYVNGEKSHDPKSMQYVSSIEAYIQMTTAKNKNLIDFLKGNRKDLVL